MFLAAFWSDSLSFLLKQRGHQTTTGSSRPGRAPCRPSPDFTFILFFSLPVHLSASRGQLPQARRLQRLRYRLNSSSPKKYSSPISDETPLPEPLLPTFR